MKSPRGKPRGIVRLDNIIQIEIAIETRLNRTLLDATIKGHMEGRDVICDTMMCKYASSESLNLMIDRALDLFCEYGGLEANPRVKVFRGVRVITIFAGTTATIKTIHRQVHRLVKACCTLLPCATSSL